MKRVFLAGMLFIGVAAPATIWAGAPAEPAATSWLQRGETRLALGLGLAALLSQELEDEAGFRRSLDRFPVEGAIDLGDLYGRGETAGLAAVGLLTAGGALGDPRLGQAGEDLSQSLLLTWGTVWTLKVAVNARRPNGGRYSFPSGHTATAFAMAPVARAHGGRVPGYLAFGMAGLTALARMEDDKHYLADVLVGAAIGIWLGEHAVSGRALPLHVTASTLGLGVSLGF